MNNSNQMMKWSALASRKAALHPVGKALGLSLVGLSACLLAVPASSAPLWDGNQYSVYDTKDAPPDLVEEKVYINQDTTVAAGEDLTGSIGSNTTDKEAYWNTTDEGGLVGQGNGFATIKGGADDGLIHDITFGVYNSYFEDVIFSAIPVNQQEIDITVTATFSDGSSETSSTLQTANGLEAYLVLADTGKLFKEVNISSDSGMVIAGPDSGDTTDGGATQFKQWQVSGVTPVPIPAAVWFFGSGLIGLAGIARRKKA